MDLSTNINNIQPSSSTEGYTARASVKDGSAVDTSTSSVTGDRTSGLFAASKKDDKQTSQDFLMLLIAQRKNQDPLSPMDNTQMLQQLSMMQQVEGTNSMVQGIQNLQDAFKGTVDAQENTANSISNSSAVSLIGKQVRLRQTSLSYAGQEAVPVYIHLGNAPSAIVEIKDDSGTVIRTLETSTKDAENSAAVVWDGMNDKGEKVDSGTYTINIQGQAYNSELYAFVQNVVQGVRFTDTGALIKVGGMELPTGNIMDVSMTDTGASAFGSLSQDSALGLIGKTVRIASNAIVSHAVNNEKIAIRVNGAEKGLASNQWVEILDGRGEVVDRIQMTADDKGVVYWDGRMAEGQDFAPAGRYTIQIANSESNPYLYTYIQGTVDAVSSSDGIPMVKVNDLYYSTAQVLEVGTGGSGV
jgi:flagellar basal-body rod modification protein FlgD